MNPSCPFCLFVVPLMQMLILSRIAPRTPLSHRELNGLIILRLNPGKSSLLGMLIYDRG